MARSLSVLTESASHLVQFGGRSGPGRYDDPLPMLARVDLRGSADVRAALARPPEAGADVSAAVASIVHDVRSRGDAAVRELTERFDHCHITGLAVPEGEPAAALERL